MTRTSLLKRAVAAGTRACLKSTVTRRRGRRCEPAVRRGWIDECWERPIASGAPPRTPTATPACLSMVMSFSHPPTARTSPSIVVLAAVGSTPFHLETPETHGEAELTVVRLWIQDHIDASATANASATGLRRSAQAEDRKLVNVDRRRRDLQVTPSRRRIRFSPRCSAHVEELQNDDVNLGSQRRGRDRVLRSECRRRFPALRLDRSICLVETAHQSGSRRQCSVRSGPRERKTTSSSWRRTTRDAGEVAASTATPASRRPCAAAKVCRRSLGVRPKRAIRSVANQPNHRSPLSAIERSGANPTSGMRARLGHTGRNPRRRRTRSADPTSRSPIRAMPRVRTPAVNRAHNCRPASETGPWACVARAGPRSSEQGASAARAGSRRLRGIPRPIGVRRPAERALRGTFAVIEHAFPALWATTANFTR